MKNKYIYIFLIFIALIILIMQIYTTEETNFDTRSKAAGGNTLTVCESGCQYNGGDGIQQAVDSAQNGDTIILQPGRYTRKTPTDDPQIKYRYCLVNTRGKALTIKGPGAILDGENGGDQAIQAIGICGHGGDISIDSLQIKQTLRPAIYLRNSKAVIKNVTFLDIDSSAIDVWTGSKAIILNNLFTGSAGPGINVLPLPGDAYVKIENNTFYANGGAGIIFNLCDNSQLTGNVENNIIVNPGDLFGKPLSGSGIGAECPNQQQKISAVKTANNIVWKGKLGGCLEGPDEKSSYADCVAGEICTGTTVAYPYFVGADEKGSVCVHGEGILEGDFHTKPNSPAANIGVYNGPCADGNSSVCYNYISQYQTQSIQPSSPPPTQPVEPSPTLNFTQPTTNNPNPTSSYNPPPINPGVTNYVLPTSANPQATGNNNQPSIAAPITYYLPATIAYNNPSNPNNPIPTNIPAPTPTKAPFIDVKKTVDNAKKTWNNFVAKLILISQTILP